MTKKSNRTSQFDLVGMLSSGLCLIHCLFLPFFVSASHHADWHFFHLDYLFLLIGFWAVWHADGHARTKGIRYMLWTSYLVLAMAVIWEGFYEQVNWIIYPASLALIAGHYLNLKKPPKAEAIPNIPESDSPSNSRVSTPPKPMAVGQEG